MSCTADRSGDEPTLRIISTVTYAVPSSPLRRLQPDQMLAGRYRIREEVGRGGMGVVYRAQDEQLGISVALKVLRPELAEDPRLVERFRREIVAARQVTHRNAVRIHDIGRDGDLLFLTMDFVEGPSLQAVLRKERRLGSERAAGIARQLALALEAAHEAGIVHRDLKPGNVLIEPSGRACISDFGLARSPGAHDLTRTGMIVGTPAYLSPEQAHGAPVDRQSDLYALGLLLFEMLTGDLPSPEKLAAVHEDGTFRQLLETPDEEIPAWLGAIVERLLQPDPAQRFQSAGELVAALDLRRTPASPRRRLLLAAALGLPLLAIALVAAWENFSRQPLAARPRPPIVAPPLTASSPAALRDYSQGIEHLLRRDPAAAPFLERAVAADPGFTAAWIGLARARSFVGQSDQALEAARQAVRSLPSPAADSSRLSWEARALEARLKGEPQKAREILAELVDRSPEDAEARIDLAEACGEAGDLKAAIDHLQKVTAADPENPRAWLLLAKHSILAGDSRRAANEYLIRALVIQNRLGNEPGQAEVHNALGVAWYDLGELDQAAESYKRAAEIRRRLGHRRGLAATLRNLAAIDAVRGEQERAGERLTEAMQIVEQLGDVAGQADLSNDLGLLAEERGRYEEAMQHYRRALQLRRRLGRTLDIAESLNNVGYSCYLLGRFEDARVYWQQALDSYTRAEDRTGVVLVTQGIGLLQITQGDWDDAAASFRTAIAGSRELGHQESTAAALSHLGGVQLLQGRFRAAFGSFAEALSLLRDLEDVRGQTEITLAEADALLQIGDLEAASQRLDAAERLLAEGPNREQRSDLLRLRGEWHLRRGATAPAREALRQAVTEAEASHGVVALLQARIARARLEGSRRLEELRALQAEIEALDHRGLELRVTEALADAALEAGRPADAEAAARRGLQVVADCGTWSGAFRLHLLLAQALERRGLAAEAAGQRERAAIELARLRSDISPDPQSPSDTVARTL